MKLMCQDITDEGIQGRMFIMLSFLFPVNIFRTQSWWTQLYFIMEKHLQNNNPQKAEKKSLKRQ